MLQTNPTMIRPRCDECGTVLRAANVQPGLGWFSHRIFKCDRCGEVVLLREEDLPAL
jgi:hypothetical protein